MREAQIFSILESVSWMEPGEEKKIKQVNTLILLYMTFIRRIINSGRAFDRAAAFKCSCMRQSRQSG